MSEKLHHVLLCECVIMSVSVYKCIWFGIYWELGVYLIRRRTWLKSNHSQTGHSMQACTYLDSELFVRWPSKPVGGVAWGANSHSAVMITTETQKWQRLPHQTQKRIMAVVKENKLQQTDTDYFKVALVYLGQHKRKKTKRRWYVLQFSQTRTRYTTNATRDILDQLLAISAFSSVHNHD